MQKTQRVTRGVAIFLLLMQSAFGSYLEHEATAAAAFTIPRQARSFCELGAFRRSVPHRVYLDGWKDTLTGLLDTGL